MTTTTAEITSRIQYNRASRDFDCFVTIDDEERWIGSASTYTAGESKCNAYAYDHYSDNHTPEVAAAIAPGDVVVVDEAEACIECDGEGRIPSHDCCGDQAGGWAETCDFCNGTGLADPPADEPAPEPPADDDWTDGGPYARCPGTGLADCGARLPAGALFCASCTQIHHRIRWAAQFPNDQERWIAAGREWEQRSARILANVTAMLAPTCKNCGAGHSIQTCPEIRALLFAPVVRRVVAHDASA